MDSKIDVKIFGQIYTVAGGDSADYILKIAGYVDKKMKEIGNALNTSSMPDLSVLAALNIADDYYKVLDGIVSNDQEVNKLKADVDNYAKLWEEAKNGFSQLKIDSQSAFIKQEAMEGTIREQDAEIVLLKGKIEGLEIEKEALTTKLESTKEKLDKNVSSQKDSSGEMKELMEKTKELETNFFDVQMENIQLKSELEKFKKNVVEW